MVLYDMMTISGIRKFCKVATVGCAFKLLGIILFVDNEKSEKTDIGFVRKVVFFLSFQHDSFVNFDTI